MINFIKKPIHITGLVFFLLCLHIKSTKHQNNGEFTYYKLNKLISTKNITSIKDLIREIPIQMKKNFTLVYDSGSIQESSYLFPRAILFSKNSSLIMTFNGSPKQKGFNKIELMRWVNKSKQYELREISFFNAEDNKPPHISKANPLKCMQCHSSSPKPYGSVKPIFSDYPIWKGLYGSHFDSMIENENELSDTSFLNYKQLGFIDNETKNFIKFKEKVLSDKESRYYPLFERNSNTKYYPYKLNNSGGYMDVTFGNAPNTLFTDLIYTRYLEQITEKIRKNPLYNKLKYSLSATLSCGGSLDDNFIKLLNKAMFLPEKNNFNISKYDKDLIYKVLDYYNIISIDEWNLGFGEIRDSLAKSNFKTPLSKNESLRRLFSNLSYPLLNLEERGKCFKVKEHSVSPEEDTHAGLEYLKKSSKLWPTYSCKSTCSYFNKLAQTELKTFISEQLKINRIVAGDQNQVEPDIKNIISKCSGCHSEQTIDNQIGPYIPFNDPDELIPWYNLISTVTSVDEKEARHSGKKMPLGRKPLTKEERDSLLKYMKH